jgi:predicted O-methyltransferase YrrM
MEDHDLKTSFDPNQRPVEARAIGELIWKIYNSRTVRGADDQLYEIYPAALTPDRGAYLASIIRETHPSSTIEIGLARGLSTLFILRTLLENGHSAPHVVMDPFQSYGYHDAALRVLRENGLERMVEFHQEASVYLLPKLADEGRQFDFAFIDGDHSYEAVFCDFWLIDPLIRPGGVIVFDDIWAEGVDRVCRLAQEHFGYAYHGENLDPGFLYRPLMRTYVKAGPPDLRPRSKIKKLRRQFNAARSATITAVDEILGAIRVDNKREAAQKSAHAGLAALGKGDRDLARLHFYRSLRDRPFKFKTYVRLARTFLPVGLARKLSGHTVRGENPRTDR